ncbi:OmpA family protein [Cecembia sp.]|uniref:OmpA family protein n=1 Tax=Cecembia sp. TaxID=1898110 RepID=UPI0025C366B5|nr:OmpA family protein [Cecembia sp.]
MILFIIFIAGFTADAFGQVRKLRFADKQYHLENYRFAANEYIRAYEKKQTYYAAKMAAESFTKIQEFEYSLEWWEKTIAFGESSKEDFRRYVTAWIQFNNDLDYEKVILAKGYDLNDFPEFFMLKNLNKKESNTELVPLENVNSEGADFGLTQDSQNRNYFSSDRGPLLESSKKPIRIDAKDLVYSEDKYNFNDRQYLSIYKEDTTGMIERLKPIIPETYHFSDPFYVEELGILFYSVVKGQKIRNSRTKEIRLYPELYYSKLNAEGNLEDYEKFPLNDPEKHGIITPFLDLNTKRLYFSSNMEGGLGGYDLYYVEIDESFNFGPPVNLGPEVNTDKNERDPFIFEGKLYFASDGHPGLGGFDIFSADVIGKEFGSPENLGTPYNSVRDDFSYVQLDKNRKYLSSNRPGGMGMDDIYKILDLQKQFIAKVLDCDGNQINTDFDIEMLENQDYTQIGFEVDQRGTVLSKLDVNKVYTIRISKKGYFPVEDPEISTENLIEEVLEKEYTISKIPYKKTIFADLIYYDLDEAYIRQDAAELLDEVAELMREFEFMDLIVASHTDSRASNLYNEYLSKRRFDEVKNYLEQQGIDTVRVRGEWFGESILVNDCGDGVPCPEFMHQLNRRSELVLEAFSDEGMNYVLPKSLKDMDPCEIENYFNQIRKGLFRPTIVYFDFDKTAIKPAYVKDLERITLLMRRFEELHLNIEGHTDQRGGDAYNMDLAQRRALAVKKYLLDKGIPEERLDYFWFGKTRPINDCELGPCDNQMHQLNRRTELHFVDQP